MTGNGAQYIAPLHSSKQFAIQTICHPNNSPSEPFAILHSKKSSFKPFVIQTLRHSNHSSFKNSTFESFVIPPASCLRWQCVVDRGGGGFAPRH
jgi:hypothetical protein